MPAFAHGGRAYRPRKRERCIPLLCATSEVRACHRRSAQPGTQRRTKRNRVVQRQAAEGAEVLRPHQRRQEQPQAATHATIRAATKPGRPGRARPTQPSHRCPASPASLVAPAGPAPQPNQPPRPCSASQRLPIASGRPSAPASSGGRNPYNPAGNTTTPVTTAGGQTAGSGQFWASAGPRAT